MGITKKVDTERAALIKKTARLTGVSVRSVQRVLEGKQNNPKVVETFMTLEEQIGVVEDNLLLEAVKDLIPL